MTRFTKGNVPINDIQRSRDVLQKIKHFESLSAVLIDEDSIEEFFEKVADLYYENTNQYVADYTELKNKRSVEGLIDL